MLSKRNQVLMKDIFVRAKKGVSFIKKKRSGSFN